MNPVKIEQFLLFLRRKHRSLVTLTKFISVYVKEIFFLVLRVHVRSGGWWLSVTAGVGHPLTRQQSSQRKCS